MKPDKIVKDWKGELFIATSDAEWSARLVAWQKEHITKGKESALPRPMPKDHIMFTSKSPWYTDVTNEQRTIP